MTIQPSSLRTSIRCLNQRVNEDGENFSLLIPFGAEKHFVTPKTITNKSWLDTTVSLLQESLDLGLFKKGSITALVKKIFRENNSGWCQGLVDCIRARHDLRIPLPVTVQSIFNNHERLFFAQLCYEFKMFLNNASSLSKRLHALCNATCLQKKIPYKRSEYPKKTKALLQDLKKFLDHKNIQSIDDERFLLKKNTLIHKYFGKQRVPSPLLERDVGVDEDTVQKIDALFEKVSRLQTEILGGPLHSCALFRGSFSEFASHEKKHLPRERMLEVSSQRHIWLYVRQGKKLYKIDTASGLSESEGPNKNIVIGPYEYAAFIR